MNNPFEEVERKTRFFCGQQPELRSSLYDSANPKCS
jgi:hypothetical protein